MFNKISDDKMGLTAAEKMRRYREKIKANVEKYKEVKKKIYRGLWSPNIVIVPYT